MDRLRSNMNHRPALIGAMSIAGVVVAGIAAIGASLGLLHGSEGGAIGQLAADTVAPASQVVDVYDEGRPGAAQEFVVEGAGSVSVTSAGGSLRLDEVRPNEGWEWQARASSPTELRVELTDGRRTYDFTARLAAGGDITATVDEKLAQPIATSASSRHTEDDDGAAEEHEGRDDDD